MAAWLRSRCNLPFGLARAVVTSSSPAKIARAIELGAAGGYDYRDTAWAREFAQRYGAAGLVIDGAGGPGYANLVEIAGPGGRIVNYGATAGSPEKLDLFKVFWKQLRLQGTTMGSPHDFSAMCDFVVAHDVRPIVDRVLPLVEANAGAGGHAVQRAVWEDRIGSERWIDGRNARRPALGSRARTRWEAEGLSWSARCPKSGDFGYCEGVSSKTGRMPIPRFNSIWFRS